MFTTYQRPASRQAAVSMRAFGFARYEVTIDGLTVCVWHDTLGDAIKAANQWLGAFRPDAGYGRRASQTAVHHDDLIPVSMDYLNHEQF